MHIVPLITKVCNSKNKFFSFVFDEINEINVLYGIFHQNKQKTEKKFFF